MLKLPTATEPIDKNYEMRHVKKRQKGVSQSMDMEGDWEVSLPEDNNQTQPPPVTTGGGEKVALNEVGRGDDESCANPNCTIKVALPIAHTSVRVVEKISMISVVKRQNTFTWCCAPTANQGLHQR
jgi:hypothetical protein